MKVQIHSCGGFLPQSCSAGLLRRAEEWTRSCRPAHTHTHTHTQTPQHKTAARVQWAEQRGARAPGALWRRGTAVYTQDRTAQRWAATGQSDISLCGGENARGRRFARGLTQHNGEKKPLCCYTLGGRLPHAFRRWRAPRHYNGNNFAAIAEIKMDGNVVKRGRKHTRDRKAHAPYQSNLVKTNTSLVIVDANRQVGAGAQFGPDSSRRGYVGGG